MLQTTLISPKMMGICSRVGTMLTKGLYFSFLNSRICSSAAMSALPAQLILISSNWGCSLTILMEFFCALKEMGNMTTLASTVKSMIAQP